MPKNKGPCSRMLSCPATCHGEARKRKRFSCGRKSWYTAFCVFISSRGVMTSFNPSGVVLLQHKRPMMSALYICTFLHFSKHHILRPALNCPSRRRPQDLFLDHLSLTAKDYCKDGSLVREICGHPSHSGCCCEQYANALVDQPVP